ncbi:FAD-dependent oxidoreductase, partial [Vibrio parahaemolyticus]
KGVELKLGVKIEAFTGDEAVSAVKTDAGDVKTDLVIQAAGIKPATEWLKGTVNLDKRGFINTDPYLRTNLPDVYAIGDATLVYSIP